MKSTDFITESMESSETQNLGDLVDHLDAWCEDIADQLSSEVAGDSSTPAGPDTTKFRAAQKGMIEVVHGARTGGGQYDPARFYPVGIKVGSNVNSAVHDTIKGKLQGLWRDVVEEERNHQPATVHNNSIATEKGTLRFDFARGTAWSIYGFTVG